VLIRPHDHDAVPERWEPEDPSSSTHRNPEGVWELLELSGVAILTSICTRFHSIWSGLSSSSGSNATSSCSVQRCRPACPRNVTVLCTPDGMGATKLHQEVWAVVRHAASSQRQCASCGLVRQSACDWPFGTAYGTRPASSARARSRPPGPIPFAAHVRASRPAYRTRTANARAEVTVALMTGAGPVVLLNPMR
jgi:hypothetical protein